jgi:hypothetical protein
LEAVWVLVRFELLGGEKQVSCSGTLETVVLVRFELLGGEKQVSLGDILKEWFW